MNRSIESTFNSTCAMCEDCQFVRDPSNQNKPLPFEIHITVSSDNFHSFGKACRELGVKPIFIADQNINGEIVQSSLMTSSKFFGDSGEAKTEMLRIAIGLSESGFNVVRQKIEAAPWHSEAPSKANGRKHSKNQYFESHIRCFVGSDDECDLVRKIANQVGAYISQNINRNKDTKSILLTLRSGSDIIEDFTSKVDNVATELGLLGITLDKTIIEWAMYDSNLSYDSIWINP